VVNSAAFLIMLVWCWFSLFWKGDHTKRK